MKRRVREAGELPGALWHIFHPADTNKIRDLLNKVHITRHISFGRSTAIFPGSGFSFMFPTFRIRNLIPSNFFEIEKNSVIFG
jgi:hypothetical protein